MSESKIDHYAAHGYAVCRAVFDAAELERIRAATERVRALGLDDPEGNACGNAKFFVGDNGVRSATWCALQDPDLAWVRSDPRMLSILEPLLGNTLRQLINNLHWKPPGSSFTVAFHRDRVNRERGQGAAIRNLPDSYIQTGLAVDPMTMENGPLILMSGSHKSPELLPPPETVYSDDGIDTAALVEAGYSADSIVELQLEPGDVAFWGPDTVHGSGPNRHESMDRCFYVNGYARASDCFMGYWAWINGEPVPLPDKTVPVHVYGKADFSDYAKE